MRVLSPVVEPTPGSLVRLFADLFHGSAVGAKAVRHNFQRITVSFHRLLQKPQRSLAIPLLCDKYLKDFSCVINRSPEVVSFTIDSHEDLIQMPPPLWQFLHCGRAVLSYLRCKQRAEPVPPSTNRLVADVDTAFVEQVFHLSQRQREAHIHLDRQTDHIRRGLVIKEWISHPRTLRIPNPQLKPVSSDNTPRCTQKARAPVSFTISSEV